MKPSAGPAPLQVPETVRRVLAQFQREHGAQACLWVQEGGGWQVVYRARQPPGARGGDDGGGARPQPAEPGPATAPLALPLERQGCVEVVGPDPDAAARDARLLACALEPLLRHDQETRSISRELAERYEEITLLYSISETLGSVISLREAAGTILSEVVGMLGAARAALWVHDARLGILDLVAEVGVHGQQGPILTSDPHSITAAVFRDRRPMILDPGDEFPRGVAPAGGAPRGSFLSVPVSYTPPQGESRMIGVINLVGHEGRGSFSAGDQKLLAAIASQVGAAVENSRLVDATLRQERLVREMELAHDLQLKLLPSAAQLEGQAEVAARCVPAESVGGDFYHLFRLPEGRVGVVIGDVSSHGFSAALIMALAMSAVAIHAGQTQAPGEVLRRTHRALIDELETTEMYLTLFYGVLDPVAGRLSYANAGHSHAFRVSGAGEALRLDATDPPLGLIDRDHYGERRVDWNPGTDLLMLFTDGLSDALGLGEVEGEQRVLQEVAGNATEPLPELLDRVFALRGTGEADVPADDRTAVLLRI